MLNLVVAWIRVFVQERTTTNTSVKFSTDVSFLYRIFTIHKICLCRIIQFCS